MQSAYNIAAFRVGGVETRKEEHVEE